MTTQYVMQQIGVADGTVPQQRADGRQCHARKRTFLGSKTPGQAWAAGDKIFLCTKPGNEKVTEIKVTSDTSLGTTTVDIGTLSNPQLYCAAATMTAVNVPTAIGPKAATLDDPPGPSEDLYATLAVGGVGAAVLATFEIVTSGE
jgi:hypothetical protein